MVSAKFHQKNIAIELEIEPTIPAKVQIDKDLLSLIINNLLDNALKCSTKGPIIINIKLINDDNNDSCLYFSISDKGCGIPKDKHLKIFEAFSSAEPYETRCHYGVGLGLTICAKLVKLMEGQIGLESKPDNGSTFWFTVKLAE